MSDELSLAHQTRLELDASHAHHRLLAEQIAQVISDYRSLQTRLDDIAGVGDDVRTISDTLDSHIAREEAMIAQAFPNGDMNAHRSAHESMMRASQAQETFWRELRLDLAKRSIWGLLLLFLGLAVAGLVYKVGLAR